MSSTLFILAPATSSSSTSATPALTSSSTLHLLPFSLGSSSRPYRASSGSTSQYFIPRPAPPDTPGVPANTPIAAFRGRALVGQSVEVPRGYKGVILSTSARPDHGGLEERRSTGNSRNPLTPAPSADGAPADSETGRRSTRTKGAGQVALSKPRTRVVAKRKNERKRIRLDSDDEDDQDQVKEDDEMDSADVALKRTPSKRARSELSIPSIVVQQPTPRKTRSALKTTSTKLSIAETLVDEPNTIDQDLEMSPSESVEESQSGENIVPSPATEDDPPSFFITPQSSLADLFNDQRQAIAPFEVSAEPGSAPAAENEDGRAVRLLRPKATFTEITLWTPDAPLAGFRPDELDSMGSTETEVDSKNGTKAEAENVNVKEEVQTDVPNVVVKEEEAGIALHKGWWRIGGAGEGGDDFVRAMGEWLGMVEMVSSPLYLDGRNGYSHGS